jgi:preprotein translocase subunit SecG
MIYLPLAAGVPLFWKLVSYLWIMIAILMILIILIQKGKGGGLAGAFGGLGAGGVLGTKTGDFLTWVTIGLVAAFLFVGVLLVKYYKPALSEDLTGTQGSGQFDPQAGSETPPAGEGGAISGEGAEAPAGEAGTPEEKPTGEDAADTESGGGDSSGE